MTASPLPPAGPAAPGAAAPGAAAPGAAAPGAAAALAINPALETAPFQERFAADGHVHVPDVLTAAAAQALHDCLAREVDWHVVFNHGGAHRATAASAFEALPADKREALRASLYAQARGEFRYLYRNYPIDDMLAAGACAYPTLAGLHGFLNSPAFLDVARAITGFDDVRFCDAQATCYGPGDFLTCHQDDVAGKNRRAAYILNLTPVWSSDWGGLLQFVGDDGHVRRALKPSFNALNILAVPQPHAVSLVAPFGLQRYSITGWLRTA